MNAVDPRDVRRAAKEAAAREAAREEREAEALRRAMDEQKGGS